MKMNRRDFLRGTAAGIALGALPYSLAHSQGARR